MYAENFVDLAEAMSAPLRAEFCGAFALQAATMARDNAHFFFRRHYVGTFLDVPCLLGAAEHTFSVFIVSLR